MLKKPEGMKDSLLAVFMLSIGWPMNEIDGMPPFLAR